MKLQRVLSVGFAGIANRGWQEMQRSVDRMALSLCPNRSWSSSWFEHLDPRPSCRPAWDAAPARHTEGGTEPAARFFAGAGDEGIGELIVQRFPEACTRIIAQADAARRHRLKLMGYDLRLNEFKLDWHRDAVSGCKAPRMHWSRIDPLDRNSVGDSKVTWELSRHQWLVGLAQAYRLTGDEAYAEAATAAMRDWMHDNPPGVGINWASSLEVSFRLIAWCWIRHLLAGSRALTTQLDADIPGWIRVHAAHVEKYLSYYFSPNTHLTGEALGLVYAGVLFPELKKAARWRRVGSQVLLEQLPRQVLPDGVYFEQATCYARYTAEIYLHFLVLAERNGIGVPSAAKERIGELLDYLVAIRRPDGTLPQIGDADGGRLMPLAGRGADDCRGVLAVAAAIFGRSDYAWAAGGNAPEVAWLLGREGCRKFDALTAAPPEAATSRLFPEGGYAIMRSGWERDAHQLLLDAGPLGCPFSGGHGHADLLSVQCATFGSARLVDPGTYCYTGEPEWRNYFRSTRAHNTVTVDGGDQAIQAGPFSWRDRPRARASQWITTPEFDFMDAAHNAYERLSDPVVHRRRVLFVKQPCYWILVDDIYGSDAHRIEQHFQFAPSLALQQRDGWTVCSDADGRGLFLRSLAAVDLEASIREGDVDPIAGWVSPDYGVRIPSAALIYSAEVRLPLRIVTLIVPKDSTDPSAPCVTREMGRMHLDFTAGRESVTVDDSRITVERQGGNKIEPLSVER